MAITHTDSHPAHDTPFILASPVMCQFMEKVERVARHMGTVLIVGETGTGKERIAYAIHQHSLRTANPFVDVNCAALPEHLVESELFGYEKGAFSGADTGKPGLFELAHTGTIFLDEIGELDLKLQVKLLRILDRAPYYRLGGHRKIITDIRVVAATNRDLKEEVRAGRFRKDLYHRLSQFELAVPPLRQRREDIVALAEYLVAQDGMGRKLSADALQVLCEYAWPGNVRELQNVINKALFATTSDEIQACDVLQELDDPCEPSANLPERSTSDSRLEQLEAQTIQRALEKTSGHRGQAAVELGISRRTLSRRLRDYGLANSRANAPYAVQEDSPTDEERQSFRTELRIPVLLVMADDLELACTTTDLSASGMGLEGVNCNIRSRRGMRVRFRLPDTEKALDMQVKLAWDDKHGNVGLIFADRDAANGQEIRQWLNQRMQDEGWGASSYLSASPEDSVLPNYSRIN